MKQYHAEIEIDATPEQVWAILIDTANWPSFDPYCLRIEGETVLGAKITVFNTLAPGRAFPLTITTLSEPHQLAWTGGLPLGMLKNVRTHTLTPQGPGTRFEIGETVSGPMLAAIAGAIPDLDEPFNAFCHGLKARAEARRGTP